MSSISSSAVNWGPRDRHRAASAGLVLGAAGLVLHGCLLLGLGPLPGHEGPQVIIAVVQVLATAATWILRAWLPSWFWPTIVVITTLLVGTVPLTYPEAALGVLCMLFVIVMYAARFLGPHVARFTAVEAVLVAGWILAGVEGARVQVLTDLVLAGGALVLIQFLLTAATDEQVQLVQQLRHQADVDTLTGLAARSAFGRHLMASMQGDSPTALLMVDIDHFKTVNDVHGHPAGDAVLADVAATLAGAVRRQDAVVGRLGGDELAILLHGCSPDDAWRVAQELAHLIRRRPVVLSDGTAVDVSVSIGLACTHGSSTSSVDTPGMDSDDAAAALYARADAALYQAKGNGRGRAEQAPHQVIGTVSSGLAA